MIGYGTAVPITDSRTDFNSSNDQPRAMKKNISNSIFRLSVFILTMLSLIITTFSVRAQDSASTEAPVRRRIKPVKNTFESQWIIDNQTVLVPVKGTLEIDFQHRFGPVTKGYQDLWGLFSPSFNARFGASYTVRPNLSVGLGITKDGLSWDGSVKYSVFTETPNKYPVSLTVFGDWAIKTSKDAALYDGSEIMHSSDRYTFYVSAMAAKKINEKLSVQFTLGLAHQNAVSGYYTQEDSGKHIYQSMNHEQLSMAICGRYKLTQVTSIMVDYDQPLTKHPDNNPSPSLSFGFEFNTSGHSFQIFATNYTLLIPQNNNLWNKNVPFSYTDKATGNHVSGGQWCIGFNLTRLWNY